MEMFDQLSCCFFSLGEWSVVFPQTSLVQRNKNPHKKIVKTS